MPAEATSDVCRPIPALSPIEQRLVAALARYEVPEAEQARLLAMLRHEVRWFPPTERVQAEWNCYKQVVRLLGGADDA